MRRLVLFEYVEEGDILMHNNAVVAEDAHYSDGEIRDGYIFTDTQGNVYRPEDFSLQNQSLEMLRRKLQKQYGDLKSHCGCFVNESWLSPAAIMELIQSVDAELWAINVEKDTSESPQKPL